MKSYHFVGIGGIGMSGLAKILAEGGASVTGSDAAESEMVELLRKKGIKVTCGHAAENVPEGACVVYSSGICKNNPELKQAEVLHRSLLLQQLLKGTKSLVVTGTHGKTTTSSLLAHVLMYAGLDPSYAIGGVLLNSGENGAKGKGDYFIAEGDESDASFLHYTPSKAIITNIGLDHMDHYKSASALYQAFKDFGNNVEDLFFCIEDEGVKACAFSGTSYGFIKGADLKGSSFRQEGWNLLFDLDYEGWVCKNIEVPLVGYHNALNALAVFGMALKVGLDEAVIREAFKSFKGVKRRSEFKGKAFEVELRDDYAHHPTEIKATLKALKMAARHRCLHVFFQPHRYSRTKHCLEEFANAFDDADEVVITDIYGAGESPDASIHAQDVVRKIQEASRVPVKYGSNGEVRPLSIAVTMGAGDIWKEGERLKVKKYKLGLVFGGRSAEHEISLKSAFNVDLGLDREIFDIVYFFISKKGKWSVVNGVGPSSDDSCDLLSSAVLEALKGIDIAFPVLHGTNGEDGTVQGFFEMLNIPYVGSDHQSSAICMDKVITKKLVESSGVKTAPWVDFSRYDWKKEGRIQVDLSFPLYVKPVHLGSAIGVKKVNTQEELALAIEDVFARDDHVLIEEEICGREIEFAVFGAGDVRVFPPGEVLAGGNFYDYEAKYGESGFKTNPKADLDPVLIQKGMELAKRAYKSVGCDGFARVDFFLAGEEFILNEINPIPGFTEISLYPKMCEAGGLQLQELLKELICIALSRHRLKERLL